MSIITNRAQRRQLARDNAKMPTALQPVPRELWPTSAIKHLAALRSRDFLVQVFPAEAPAVVRLSICRTSLTGDRWTDGITWDELQRLKAESGYPNETAVEVFPPERDIVNVANMRHLWVLAAPLPFAWSKQ